MASRAVEIQINLPHQVLRTSCQEKIQPKRTAAEVFANATNGDADYFPTAAQWAFHISALTVLASV